MSGFFVKIIYAFCGIHTLKLFKVNPYDSYRKSVI